MDHFPYELSVEMPVPVCLITRYASLVSESIYVTYLFYTC